MSGGHLPALVAHRGPKSRITLARSAPRADRKARAAAGFSIKASLLKSFVICNQTISIYLNALSPDRSVQIRATYDRHIAKWCINICHNTTPTIEFDRAAAAIRR